MSNRSQSPHEGASSLTFPIFVFAASRVLLFVLAKSGPLFGPLLGADPALSPTFLAKYPTLAALAHGDIAQLARIAQSGYGTLPDVAHFPLLPGLGKGLGALFGSVELGLLAASLVLCALGFVGAFRVIAALRGPLAARWGLALLAAFPLSYHLSDGSALAALFAGTAWGIALAVQGRALLASATLALGVLAHPFAVFAAPALLWPPSTSDASDRPRPALPVRIVLSLVPIAALVVTLVVLGNRFHAVGGAFQTVFLHTTPRSLPAHWLALLGAFGPLLVVGLVVLARGKGLRVLAIVGALLCLFALAPRDPASAYALAACWPAFIVWGDLLGRRESLRGPVVSVLATLQGLLLYCFTHFVRFS